MVMVAARVSSRYAEYRGRYYPIIPLWLPASGMEPEETAGGHNMSLDDIRAALLYAAKVLGREEVIVEAGTQTLPRQEHQAEGIS